MTSVTLLLAILLFVDLDESGRGSFRAGQKASDGAVHDRAAMTMPEQ